MKKAIFIFLLSAALMISCKNEPFNIVPIDQLSSIDSIKNGDKMTTSKADYFLVEGYRNSKEIQDKLDSFIERSKGENPASYFQYDMIFYKKSSQTNLESINKNRRIIDRYSQEHDLIYSYSWSKGVLVSRMKFRNGQPVDRL